MFYDALSHWRRMSLDLTAASRWRCISRLDVCHAMSLWRMHMRRAIAALLLTFLGVTSVLGETCNLTKTFTQPDIDHDTKKKVTRKVLYDDKSIVFSAKMRVDADGGPRTYSAKDPTGTLCDPQKHPENANKDPSSLGCAMDTVCVGVNVQTPTGTLDYHQCPALQNAFRRLRDADWELPGYKLLPVGVEMEDDKNGIPCLDVNETYLVSTSSTPSGEGGGKCEQKKWLDTLVPSIVVPKCWASAYRKKKPHECQSYPMPGFDPGVETGDLVALRGRSSHRATYAVIGDLGPNTKLGEASVGLLMKAAGHSQPPTYVRAANALDGLEQLDVIIFKGTKYTKPLNIAHADDMAKAAEDTLTNWTGNPATSMKQLEACAQIVAPPHH
jgi:hypothetical protein